MDNCQIYSREAAKHLLSHILQDNCFILVIFTDFEQTLTVLTFVTLVAWFTNTIYINSHVTTVKLTIMKFKRKSCFEYFARKPLSTVICTDSWQFDSFDIYDSWHVITERHFFGLSRDNCQNNYRKVLKHIVSIELQDNCVLDIDLVLALTGLTFDDSCPNKTNKLHIIY